MQNNQTAVTAEAAEEKEIDLLELFWVVWEHKTGIILISVLGAIAAIVFTFAFISPKYRTGFTAYVNNRTETNAQAADALTSGDTSAQQQLTRTYASIITSRPLIEAAIQDSGLNYSYGAVASGITTNVETNTALINVYVTMTKKEDAKLIADSLVKLAPDSLSEIVEGSSMKIVSYPVMPEGRYSPSFTKNAMLGAVAGFALAVAYVVIRSLTDTTIKSEKDLEEKFGISVIGTIPNFQEAAEGSGNKYYYQSSSKKPAPAAASEEAKKEA